MVLKTRMWCLTFLCVYIILALFNRIHRDDKCSHDFFCPTVCSVKLPALCAQTSARTDNCPFWIIGLCWMTVISWPVSSKMLSRPAAVYEWHFCPVILKASDTPSMEATYDCCFSLLKKWSTLKEKNFLPLWSKVFYLRVYPEGAWYTGKQTGSHKNYSPSKTKQKISQVNLFPISYRC